MYAHIHDRRLFTALFIGLVVLAWLALWGWGQSPFGNSLHHHTLGGVARDPTLLLVAIAGWLVMIVAMMLPTSLPLIGLFVAMTRRRPDRWRLLGLLVGGYLAIWALFGLAAHLGDAALHVAITRSLWLTDRAWALGALTLLVAGVYQFTPLKYHCLDQCRSPMGFIAARWRGRAEGRQAVRLGLAHGLYCLGCCWSLMLLMFAVGAGNLGWMLLLGALMAAEKNLPWGRKFSPALGLALVALGMLVLLGGPVPGAAPSAPHQH
jgi:predicted metal-binding membrane protein